MGKTVNPTSRRVPTAERIRLSEEYDAAMKDYRSRSFNPRGKSENVRPVEPSGYLAPEHRKLGPAAKQPAVAPVAKKTPAPKVSVKVAPVAGKPAPVAAAPVAPPVAAAPAAGGTNLAASGRAVPIIRSGKNNSIARTDPNRDVNARFNMLIPGGRATSPFWKP